MRNPADGPAQRPVDQPNGSSPALVQGIVPEEKDAADLLDQAQQLAKLNSKPIDLQVRQLVDNTRAAIQDEHFDQATKLLMQARLLAPQDHEVQKALSESQGAACQQCPHGNQSRACRSGDKPVKLCTPTGTPGSRRAKSE